MKWARNRRHIEGFLNLSVMSLHLHNIDVHGKHTFMHIHLCIVYNNTQLSRNNERLLGTAWKLLVGHQKIHFFGGDSSVYVSHVPVSCICVFFSREVYFVKLIVLPFFFPLSPYLYFISGLYWMFGETYMWIFILNIISLKSSSLSP